MKRFILLILIPTGFCSFAQKVSLDPSISPALFRYNDQITVVYDVTGTSLASLTNAWAWVWIPGKSIDAKYNINPASNNTSLTNNAKFTRSTPTGKVLFTLTFKPSDFFNQSISAETQMGILLKGNDWSNGQTTDYIATFWDGSFQVKLLSPTSQPLFVNTNDVINIQAETPVAADFELFVNDVLLDSEAGITNYTYSHTVTETSDASVIKIKATSGSNTSETSFQYLISVPSPAAQRPAGIIPGINYDSDNTKATLCLLAPGKSSVYVRGDFSDWDVLPENLMNKDGEYFWIQLDGLTPGIEYAFQYLVDESIWIVDPFADKILDPDDQYIPATTYPDLKTYPVKALASDWYNNRLSVLQTDQQPYTWQVTDFTKPVRSGLVIYELLIRDYFGNGERNYQNLIDTLTYLKRLGINAIELMPIMEFNGNESWGYNPTFMFAPDKYYGTKNKLKEFIDVCHQNGIAVILDIAMNHQDIPNSYVLMDFNFSTFKPNPTNKWFNVDATHPFSVFYDMNHESPYTKQYLDTVNYYWLNEYKVDGFRFDLSKGFTQTNSGGNVSAWSNYDLSRINILKRMADKIWQHTPGAYIILEHFANNTEEKELAEYRAAEDKGMMLWGNSNYAYNQNTMGYEEGSEISWTYHATRGWSQPHVVGYMESHDEERLMYKNLQFGNSSGSYSVKNLNTALERIKAAATIFYTIPGPKMLWQFGELGYDVSIDEGGRISPKPVRWEYREDFNRYQLYRHVGDLIRLKKTFSVFRDGSATLPSTTGLFKQMMLKNKFYTPTPSDSTQLNAVIAVNFGLLSDSKSVTFPHTGTWYEYYSGQAIEISGPSQSISLPAGKYVLYTDVQVTYPLITAIDDGIEFTKSMAFPNPVENVLTIESERNISALNLFTLQGMRLIPQRVDENSWDVGFINRGIYIVEIMTSSGVERIKIMKQ